MRRLVVATMSVLALAAVMVMSTGSTDAQGQTCLTVTSQGSVQGLDHGASCAFLGIPFAAPPIAGLRWKAPQPRICFSRRRRRARVPNSMPSPE